MPIRRWSALIVSVALVAACGTTEPDPGEPPALPLEESMAFDLETFPSGASAVDGPSAIAAQSGVSHHTVAALTVVAINAAVLVVTSVPRLTWAALASRQPTFEDDGRWHWRASTSILGVTYSGDLAGYIADGEVHAEVRITSPEVSDFLWYEGIAPVGGTSGEWLVYDHRTPTTQTLLSRVDWAHPGTDEWTLTFTAVGGANPGDSLTYDVEGDLRSVTWYDASEDESYGIVWNAVTREGSITAANYNNGQTACWDGDLQDVPCA